MQPQPIILLPPTHEQTTPSYHVEGSLKEEFQAFLKSQGVEAWQPPEKMGNRGPDERSVVEIRLEAGTSIERLESLIEAFLVGRQREGKPASQS